MSRSVSIIDRFIAGSAVLGLNYFPLLLFTFVCHLVTLPFILLQAAAGTGLNVLLMKKAALIMDNPIIAILLLIGLYILVNAPYVFMAGGLAKGATEGLKGKRLRFKDLFRYAVQHFVPLYMYILIAPLLIFLVTLLPGLTLILLGSFSGMKTGVLILHALGFLLLFAGSFFGFFIWFMGIFLIVEGGCGVGSAVGMSLVGFLKRSVINIFLDLIFLLLLTSLFIAIYAAGILPFVLLGDPLMFLFCLPILILAYLTLQPLFFSLMAAAYAEIYQL